MARLPTCPTTGGGLERDAEPAVDGGKSDFLPIKAVIVVGTILASFQRNSAAAHAGKSLLPPMDLRPRAGKDLLCRSHVVTPPQVRIRLRRSPSWRGLRASL